MSRGSGISGREVWNPEGRTLRSRAQDPLVPRATSVELSVCQKAVCGTPAQKCWAVLRGC